MRRVVTTTASSNRLRGLLPMLIDIVAPIVVYFILHSLERIAMSLVHEPS